MNNKYANIMLKQYRRALTYLKIAMPIAAAMFFIGGLAMLILLLIMMSDPHAKSDGGAIAAMMFSCMFLMIIMPFLLLGMLRLVKKYCKRKIAEIEQDMKS